MKHNKIFPTSSIFGTILVTLGSLYLADAMHLLRFDFRTYLISWPMFFILWGTLIINKDRQSFLGYSFILGGGLFLAEMIYPFIHVGSQLIIPVLLIATGARFLFRDKQKSWKQTCEFEYKHFADRKFR